MAHLHKVITIYGILCLPSRREGVSELWMCYPLTEEETPQAADAGTHFPR
jgi:hypothetical protein